MLKFLHIENIAVIERAGIEFSSGLNVLTGETGAGKSIIIDSLLAVLGHRTSKEIIRNGCDNAFVRAVFSLLPDEAVEIFSDAGITADCDGNYVIERKLSVNGAGYVKVNGVPVNATFLKEVSPLLVNIHGQHDNESLLNPDNHYIFVDKIAQNEELLLNYKEKFKEFNGIRKSLKSLEMNEDEKLRKIDLLNYQINELTSADLKEGEMEELKSRLSVAKSAEKRIKDLNNVKRFICNSDDEGGALELLKNAVHSISVLGDDTLNQEQEKLLDALENLTYCSEAIEKRIEELSSDDYDVDKIGDRLSYLKTLSLKYGKDEKEMLSFLENATKELNAIMFNDEEIERLEEQLLLARDALVSSGEKLSKSREKAGKLFETQVKDILTKLSMPSALISVEQVQGKYGKNGCDVIQFLFSANKGESKKPLSKIASGGELSRIMLSIKSVLAEKDEVDTLIFDEIDSGISGRTADMVANQLKKVSNNHQVICVTHLAQIAVAANHHLLITKDEKAGRTYTDVSLITGEQRVKEIARIMGGINVSETVLASAEELLKNKSDC